MKNTAELRYGPSFLIIGAHRGGTTGIHQLLRKHPQLKDLPEKEIHYFDRDQKYSSPSHFAESSFFKRFKDSSFREIFQRLLKNLFIEGAGNFFWYRKFVFKKISDDWYRQLFKHVHGFKSWEATPAYSLLELEDIQKIKNLFPELKVIFSLRNPIDRSWSHLRYTGRKKISPHKLAMLLKSPEFSQRNAYCATLEKWESIFGKDQVLKVFFEDFESSPQKVAEQLSHFLKIEAFPEGALIASYERFNASAELDCPAEIRQMLAENLKDEIQRVRSRIGGRSLEWNDTFGAPPR